MHYIYKFELKIINLMLDKWNSRFSSEEYVYGITPNIFFSEQLKSIECGKILLPGEGEGRNAVHAAEKGWTVDAVDWSVEAKKKAIKLAEKKSVKINYQTADLYEYEPDKNKYDACALIFIHLEEEARESLHKKVIDALKPGGKIILEAYEKEQIKKNTGGPKELNLLYSLEDIVNDFIELDFEYLAKEIISLDEGILHKGEASVIRFVGVKK